MKSIDLRTAVLFTLMTWLVSSATTTAYAENWPSWRGPTQNGISTETSLPTEWSTSQNVAWKLPMPGEAGSTPAVWGDRIFLTSVDGDELVLLGISTAGKQLWRASFGTGNKQARGDEGNSASPSVSTDGKHVWAMMGTGMIGCYTVDGKEVWKFDLQDRYGKLKIAFGMSSTPVYHDGRLYVQLIHGDGKAETQEAVVVALNSLTGEEIWKQDRVTGATNENEHSYASPILYNFGETTYLISHGADYTIAHSLNDGSEIWRLEGLNPKDAAQGYHKTLRFVASPAVSKDLIVIPTAKNYPVFSIRPDAKGTFGPGSDKFVWEFKKTPDVPSPLILDGLVYLCMQNGNLHCLDAESGEELYQSRTHVDRHRASPVYADGKIYLTARDGTITVVQPGREFKKLAENRLGETITASPAIADGTIYLRTWDHLWAIRAK